MSEREGDREFSHAIEDNIYGLCAVCLAVIAVVAVVGVVVAVVIVARRHLMTATQRDAKFYLASQ